MKKNFSELALKMHEENGGKVSIQSKVKVKCKDDLSTAYTPGVAEPCLKIKENKDDVYKYTCKSNMVAVVSDGTAVLGLGNIGASASIPVMEGKSILFKEFANVDASYLDQLSELHNTLIAAAKTIAAPTMPLEKAREDFKKTAQYQSVKELLLESFYWKVSSYILQISICYGESSVEKFSYKFSLDESEITEFKRDIETAMECAMDNQYGQSPAFYYPLKDYVETRNTYANT